MYITKWIEGERNLEDFCQKRFHESPRFVETIGHFQGNQAKVYKIYKYREDRQEYVPMYLLFMEHPKGTVPDISSIQHQTYEQIRTDKGSVLVP